MSTSTVLGRIATRSRREARRPLVEALETRSLLSILVTTSSDVTNPADGVTSLREAIIQANAGAGHDSIEFGAGITSVALGGVLPTLTDPAGVSISGSPFATVTINGGGSAGIFRVAPGAQAMLAFLNVTGGNATRGGAVYNEGTLVLTQSAFAGNHASDSGGAVFSGGATARLDVSSCSFRGNDAGQFGGAIAAGQPWAATPIPGGTVDILRSTFAKNRATGNSGGAVYTWAATDHVTECSFEGNSATWGGGLYAEQGTLTLHRGDFGGNSASMYGGALHTLDAGLVCTESSFAGNNAQGGGAVALRALHASPVSSFDGCSFQANRGTVTGGALWSADAGASTTVTRASFLGNTAGIDGGAIFLSNAALEIRDSALTGNRAGGTVGFGGAITVYEAGSRLTAINCTIAGNTATSNGGGIDVQYGNAELISCTVANNTGGGLFVRNSNVILGGTLVAGNSGGYAHPTADIDGVITSAGYNLIRSTAALTILGSTVNILGFDPLLAPLGDYGGGTLTLPLLPGSPAIDANGRAAPPADQRGIARVGPADIGAYESRGFSMYAPPVPPVSEQQTAVNTPFPYPLMLGLFSPYGEPVAGGKIRIKAPETGASAVLSATALTVGDGPLEVTAVANGTPGTYSVVATASGCPRVTFRLTNLPAAAPAKPVEGGIAVAITPGVALMGEAAQSLMPLAPDAAKRRRGASRA